MPRTTQYPRHHRSTKPIEDWEEARRTWRNALWSHAAQHIEDTTQFRERVKEDPRTVFSEMYDVAFPPAHTVGPREEQRQHEHHWLDVTEMDKPKIPILAIEACQCGAVREAGRLR